MSSYPQQPPPWPSQPYDSSSSQKFPMKGGVGDVPDSMISYPQQVDDSSLYQSAHYSCFYWVNKFFLSPCVHLFLSLFKQKNK